MMKENLLIYIYSIADILYRKGLFGRYMMKKTRGIGILLVLCLTFVASVLIFQKNTGEVSAAALPGDYYFLFGSQKK